MIEEPYRWLEAIANRREYVKDQLKGGTPALAVSLEDGILLLGVGTGESKVFEVFDRQAMAGLGHPADLEKLRQAAIDAAHTEAFTRAPEDVSLRRLVGFGMSPQLKTNFEQVFSAPFLVELIMAEVGSGPKKDTILRLHYDGAYKQYTEGAVVVAPVPEAESAAQDWLNERVRPDQSRSEAVDLLLQAWWCLQENKPFDDTLPNETERRAGWQSRVEERVVEIGWLARTGQRPSRYQSLTLTEIGV